MIDFLKNNTVTMDIEYNTTRQHFEADLIDDEGDRWIGVTGKRIVEVWVKLCENILKERTND